MAVRVAVATHRGFRRLFGTDTSTSTSTISSILPPASVKRKPSESLFVAGFSKRTTTERLREAFSQFGEVVHARVMTDRLSGISNGFGYVKYTTKEEAAKGIKGMDGKFLDGWIIFVEYARKRQPRQPPKQPVNNHKPEGFKHEEQKNNKFLKDRRRQGDTSPLKTYSRISSPEFDPRKDGNRVSSVERIVPNNRSRSTQEISYQACPSGYPGHRTKKTYSRRKYRKPPNQQVGFDDVKNSTTTWHKLRRIFLIKKN